MDCDHESLHDVKVVMDDLGQSGQVVGGAGSIVDNLEEGVILCTHITNMGTSEEGAEMMTLLPVLIK